MEHRVEIDTDAENDTGESVDARKRILASVRTHFLNAISFKDFEIEHKVKLDAVMADGGTIDYNGDGDDEFKLKSASLKRKTDKDTGAFFYTLKIVVE